MGVFSATFLLYSKSFVDGNSLSFSWEMSVSHGLFFSWLHCYLGFSCVFPAAESPAVPSVWQKSGHFRARDELGIFQTHICIREVCWAANSSFDPTQLCSASRDWCCQFDCASFRVIMNWPLSHGLEEASWWHGANSHKSFNLEGVTPKLYHNFPLPPSFKRLNSCYATLSNTISLPLCSLTHQVAIM